LDLRALLGASLGCVLGAIAACSGDLPPATLCPAPPKAMVVACPAQAAMSVPCIDQPITQCMRGPRDCNCAGSIECPNDPAGCYPDGDCPIAVSARASPRAHCIRLAPDDLQSMTSPMMVPGCLCGCSSCAAGGDGTGPIIAVHAPMPMPPSLTMPALAPRLQASGMGGQVGFYVRWRGIANAALNISLATGANFAEPFPFSSTFATDFREDVFWQASSYPRFTSGQDAPRGFGIVAAVMPTGMPTLMEIDCIVPFVVPP